jgi:predicted Rossmann-fold nucleotide-binding protein
VLIGQTYWSGLLDWIRAEAIFHGHVAPNDLDLIQCTDDMHEACRLLTEGLSRREEADRVEQGAEDRSRRSMDRQ